MTKWEYFLVSEVTKGGKRMLYMQSNFYEIKDKLRLFSQIGREGWELIGIDPRTKSDHVPFSSHSESYTDEVNYWF